VKEASETDISVTRGEGCDLRGVMGREGSVGMRKCEGWNCKNIVNCGKLEKERKQAQNCNLKLMNAKICGTW
jgi:hypothetical protein